MNRIPSGTNKIAGDGLKPFMARIGGKSLLKKTIVDKYFPKDYEDMVYIEPFVGGGSIYFYKEPSSKEVINDLDTVLIKMYKGFKKYDGDKISEDIKGSHSKTEFKKIKESNPTTEYGKFLKQLLLFKLSFYGQGRTYGNPRPLNPNYSSLKDRLQKTTILNTNALSLIKKYDSPNTLFYLDPPYEKSDKLYTHDTLPIKDLYDILKNIKGKFILSYNDSKECKELFKNFNIHRVKTRYGLGTEGGQQNTKTELIITNYHS